MTPPGEYSLRPEDPSMSARHWWTTLLRPYPPSRARRPPAPAVPTVEILEDRLLLSGPSAGQVAAAYGQLPLCFEANQGQTAAQVSFLARGPQSSLFLTTSGNAVLSLAPQG